VTTRTAWLLVLAVALGSAPAAAQHPAPGKSLADLAADVVHATQRYRAALERSLPIHETQVQEAEATLHERRRLHAAGALDTSHVQDAERALAAARRELDDARQAIDEADRLLFEASVQERLARLAPLRRGGFEDTAVLVRFNGTAPWSLRDVPRLERQFSRVFRRPLPVSSFGQTGVHDRLGFDHRGAIDVAVHPDSAEGRWLMRHLRASGIPFVGVRATVPGASTGPHVHVGPPSGRLLAR
jgi:hypothetical protein